MSRLLNSWNVKATLSAGLVLSMATVCLAEDSADDGDSGKQIVDCGTCKAVLFNREHSPDGRYAIGWSIRPASPKAKPVDWSKWNGDNWGEFLDQYDFLDPEITGSGAAPLVDAAISSPTLPKGKTAQEAPPYEFFDCVVSLKRRQLVPLHSSWPYWPNKNHGDLKVAWGQAGGVQYALVTNDARFYTANVWLISLQDSTMRERDLSLELNLELDRLLKAKRPLTRNDYGIYWGLNQKADEMFKNGTVHLDFTAAIPKSSEDLVEGTVILNPATGKVIKIECDTPPDDPFLDNPRLATTDRELNKVYAELAHRLTETQRIALRDEQRKWLLVRDQNAQEARENDDPDHIKRDESLIQSTKARIAELKKRLKKG